MKQIKIYTLSLFLCLLVGCSYFHTIWQERALKNVPSSNTVQKVDKTINKILFKGNNMTIMEKGQNSYKLLQFDNRQKSCLAEADEKIKRDLSSININKDVEFFEFESIETTSFGSDKFTVSFDMDIFSKASTTYLEKLDEYVGITDFRNLYFIKKNDIGYLLLIGHENASSGLKLNYMTHLIIPLTPNQSLIEFQSISDDPRRVGIDDSGSIHFIQIELNNDAINDDSSKRVPLIVSVFTINNDNKKLESRFNIDCKDINKILRPLSD